MTTSHVEFLPLKPSNNSTLSNQNIRVYTEIQKVETSGTIVWKFQMQEAQSNWDLELDRKWFWESQIIIHVKMTLEGW